jgi:hypothetical protein
MSLKARRRNSTALINHSPRSPVSAESLRRSYSRPDLKTANLFGKTGSDAPTRDGEMDAEDKSTWAKLEARYGGNAMDKFDNHVPALISPHPKSAPATFCKEDDGAVASSSSGGNDNNAPNPVVNMHKSKKEIDGEWPVDPLLGAASAMGGGYAAVAAANPILPAASVGGKSLSPREKKPKSHHHGKVGSDGESCGDNFNDVRARR